MRKIVEIVRRWASSSLEVSKVLVAGSYASTLESDSPVGESDVDLIVYLRPHCQGDAAIQSLCLLGISCGTLIHPLIIHQEDAEMKNAIPEYKQMIEAAKMIYEAKEQDVQQAALHLRETRCGFRKDEP
ncbi:MAG: hypothetical protein HY707_06935 [Ignavibacteriae bacterium]|nr:hypothetical protein [Ignavibacteriota bacterium]